MSVFINPQIMPGEFLGWYEFRLKKLNGLDYSKNTFIRGKRWYTSPRSIKKPNIYSLYDINELLDYLFNHTFFTYHIDEFNFITFKNTLATISSSKISKRDPVRFNVRQELIPDLKNKKQNHSIAHHYSKLKYCPSCFVDQVMENGFPWIKLSWFTSEKLCGIHNTEFINHVCLDCQSDLKADEILDSLFSGFCKRCNSIIWGNKDFRINKQIETIPEKFLPINFFVDSNIQDMLEKYLDKTYDELLKKSHDFNKSIELTPMAGLALHRRRCSVDYAVSTIFNGKWNEFIQYFSNHLILEYREVQIGDCESKKIQCKFLTAVNY